MKQSDTALVYIITHLELGGAQKVCLALWQGLSSQDTTYLIAGNHGALANTIMSHPNTILLNTLKRDIGFLSIWQELRSFFFLIKQLKHIKKKHHTVIVHTHCTKAGIIGRWAAFFAGIKTRIHTIHGFAFHEHQSRITWLLIYLTELITSVITSHWVCVSSADVKIGLRLFPRFAKKHSIIRAAVAEPFYAAAQKISHRSPEKSTFIFGTIACFKAQKNMFDLLRAFALVYRNYRQARLEIIGDGILRPAIEAWIEQAHLSSVITLHGWKDDVAALMLHWDSFVLSSLWEGLPCAVVEARLLQLPVLSYNTGGIHDVIISGKNGFLYPQKEWQLLAHGMNTLIQDPDAYAKLSTYPDDFGDFTYKAMLTQHHRLYHALSLIK